MTAREDLRQAYLDAVVEIAFEAGTALVAPAPVGTTDGEFPPGLSHLHVITASNPHSQVRDASDNATRNAALASDLRKVGLMHLDAVGRSPDGAWQEESFAVLDADEQHVLDLAERYGQHAVYGWSPDERAVVWAGDLRGRIDRQGWRRTTSRPGG